MSTLQSLLGLDTSNPFFEVLINPEMPDELLVHFGMRLLEKVHKGKIEEKLLAARLYNAGFSRKHLTEALGFDRKTMRRWGQALISGDAERLVRAFAGQGAERRMTPMLEHYVRATYREVVGEMGCHSNEFLRKELKVKFKQEFCHEVIRRILRDEDEKMKPVTTDTEPAADTAGGAPAADAERSAPDFLIPAPAATVDEALSVLAAAVGSRMSAPSAEEPSMRDDSCDCPQYPRLPQPGKCDNSPFPDAVTRAAFPTIKGKKGAPLLCHHAGLTLCRILIDGVTAGLGDSTDIIRQWIAMILCGCMNIENGRSLNYPALEILLGEQMWSSDRQREKLRSIAQEDVALAILERGIRMTRAECLSTFLYDPHSIEYTGQLKTLLGWLGSSHKIAKAYYQDFIHTTAGEPVFVRIDDNYSDIRERFKANVVKFRSILGGDRTRRLTFVVDRAIYDVEYLADLKLNHALEIITWEKNYRRGQWDALDRNDVRAIKINLTRNGELDTVTHTVSYVRRSWAKKPSFSQFIVMLGKPGKDPVELSVICTDSDRSDADCLIPILRRWLQENDFMFLDRLGINEITSYKSFSYEEIAEGLQDREMASKERKSLCAKRLSLRKELGLALVACEEFNQEAALRQAGWDDDTRQIEEDAKSPPTDDEGIRGRRRKLKTSMAAFGRRRKSFMEKNESRQSELRRSITELNEGIAGQEESVSRLEQIIKNEYRKLNFMPKTIMDCVKIVARNIIYNRLSAFRPIYDNRRNDHVILRELIESTGHIHEDAVSVVVSLYPSRHFPKEVKGKILDFLFDVSLEANRFYKPGKTIVFKLHEN